MIERLSNDRIHETSAFFSYTDKVLNELHNDIIVSRACAACVRHFQSERLMLALSFFMRHREALITSQYPFDVNQSSMKAITILGDPLFPSRRIEKSPLLYAVPPFPGGKTSNVLPEMPDIPSLLPLLPDVIRGLLTTPYLQFEDFALRTPRQLKLSFSLTLPLSDYMRLAILKLVLNEGKPFEFIYDVQFLYGVEPIPGLLMRSGDCLVFVEGLQLTGNGVDFRLSGAHRICYSFYMSYFIAGHFGPCSLFGAHPVLKWPMNEIIYLSQRYWLHKPIAIELNFISGWRFILIPTGDNFIPLLALVKKCVDDSFDRFPKHTPGLSAMNAAHLLRNQWRNCAKLWIDGFLDNFTYLCVLNRRGHRSLADYTQYYVFPWIIGDYNTNFLENAPPEVFRDLRLPMGQIGADRARRFDIIWEDSERHYFYGTHYMHLGVVLYFMFRIDPFCLFSIYLHRGWDHQNRLFIDIYESWMAAAYTSPADVKELIPEFFCVPEFLSNSSQLPLTTTMEGKDVADVNLGASSHNPHDFVQKMRHFLQSPQISSSLHCWIDLIFGFKSRGEPAVEAKNLFHPLSYAHDRAGPEVEGMESSDQIEREAAATCVLNFGQCCSQVFKSPHPPQTRRYVRNHIMTDPTLLIHQRLNTQGIQFPVSDVRFRANYIATASGNSALLPSADVVVADRKLSVKGHVLVNEKFLGSTSAVCVSRDGVWLALGQAEGGVAIYLFVYNDAEIIDVNLVQRFPTTGAVGLCAVSSCHFLMVAACGSIIERIDIGTRRVIDPIETGWPINCLAFDDYGALLLAGGHQVIAVWTLSGELLMQMGIDSAVTSIAAAELPEFVENRFFVTGHANGSMKFWTINYGTMAIVLLKSMRVTRTAVRRIAIDYSGMKVVCLTNEEMFCFDYFGSAAADLKREYAVECGECSSPIEKTSALVQNIRICSNCHRFLCQNCLPKGIGFPLGVGGKEAKERELCPHCVSVAKHRESA
jgi:hypothetical protein